jgi:hypothetical protein
MIKAIDFDGYNQAEIHKMYEDGSCICTVKQVEEEVTIKEDTNIILMNGVHFKLTKSELNILTKQDENETGLTA